MMKMKKTNKTVLQTVLSCLLIAAVLTATIAMCFAGYGNAFNDVKTSDWFNNAVTYCADNKLISGTGANTFSPYDSMTRGQVVTILSRMDKIDEANWQNTGKFTDVKTGQYYTPAVMWAVKNGITSGTSATTFTPMAGVTKEQFATFLSRYIASKGVTLPNNPSVSRFTDEGNISNFARSAMEVCRKAGILGGDNNGYVQPKKILPRCEGAQMMMKAHQALAAAGVKFEDNSAPADGDNVFVQSFTVKQEYITDTQIQLTPVYIPANANAVKLSNGKVYKDLSVRYISLSTRNDGTTVSSNGVVTFKGDTYGFGINSYLNAEYLAEGNSANCQYVYVERRKADTSKDDTQQQGGQSQGGQQGQTGGNTGSTVNVNSTEYQNRFQNEFFKLLNTERQQQGLSLVVIDDTLNQVSQLRVSEVLQKEQNGTLTSWNDDSSNKIVHTRLSGDPFTTAYPNNRFCGFSKGENAIRVYPIKGSPETLAKECFDGWMGSKGHRKLLMTSGDMIFAGLYQYSENNKQYAMYESCSVMKKAIIAQQSTSWYPDDPDYGVDYIGIYDAAVANYPNNYPFK